MPTGSCTAVARGAAVRITLAAALVLTLSAPAGGQSVERLAFTSYDMRDGLSHGQVWAILQDSAGFLWIGTQDGVDRFDGSGFRAYRSNPLDSTSLAGDYVKSLALASDGRLWVGTLGAGLSLLDPLTGVAQQFALGQVGASGEPAVRGIVVDVDGTLLLDTDRGLLRFDPQTGVSQSATIPEGGGDPTVICGLVGGGALVGTDGGAVARVGASGAEMFQLSGPVRVLRCPESAGPAFAVANQGEVFSLDLVDRVATMVARMPDVPGDSLRIRDIIQAPDSTLWIASSNGLWVLRQGAPEPVAVANDAASRALPHSDVRRLILDSSGVLWVGTWDGIAGLHPLHGTMRRVFMSTEDPDGLPGQGVIALEIDSGGRAWVGTDGAGLRALSPGWREGEISVESPPSLVPWDQSVIFGLATDGAGDLWIAAFWDGLLRVRATGEVARIPVRTDAEDAFVPAAYSVLVDRQGEIWAGSFSKGLLRYNEEIDRFVPFEDVELPEGSEGPWVWPLAEGPDGSLWVGVYDGGLARLSPEREIVETYVAGPGGLSSNRVMTLFADQDGTIWVGTEGAGLNRIDPATGQVSVYDTGDGLPHDNVEAIVRDDGGFLWISTADGLARLDEETGEILVFKEASGLAGDKFLANSVERGPDGQLLFGGAAGITIVDPGAVEQLGNIPPAALTAFRIQGRPASLARAMAPEGLDLEPDENFFAFEFAAMDFVDPSQNRYRYRLEGLDPDWVDAGATPVANYTSVPPARYVFRVAARNSEGIWNEDALAIDVRVQAPFHQTLWFRASMLLLALAAVSAIYAFRLRQIHARQELRLNIAGRLHDDIGANLSAIALKAEVVRSAQLLDDRRRGQLGDVAQLARDTAHKVRETVWVVNTRYDSVQGLLAKMRDTADVILEGQAEFTFDEPTEVPPRKISMQTRQDVYLLFKETLHNVVKHARASSVAIQVSIDSTEIRFRVADDGVGFDPQTPGGGNGRALMEDRVARCRGSLSISSQPGAGTTVDVTARLR